MGFGEALVWVLCVFFLVRLFNCLLDVISGWLSMAFLQQTLVDVERAKGCFLGRKTLQLGPRIFCHAWHFMGSWACSAAWLLNLRHATIDWKKHYPQVIFFFTSLCWRRMLFFLSAMWDQWIPPLHRQGNLGNLLSHGTQKWHRRATRTLQAIGHKTVSLTGWWFQPLWKIWVSWGDEIPNNGKNPIKNWLVVGGFNHLENMSQWEGLSQLLVVYLPQYMENKIHVPNHQPVVN